MKTILRIFPFLLLSSGICAQTLVSATKIRSYTTTELVFQGIFSAKYPVDLYKIVYNTTDVLGNPTIASGALSVPIVAECDSLPLVNYNHGTVLLKSSVPSQMGGEEVVGLSVSAVGAIATMPDYLGLGDGPGLHPYQHAESEATATLDMIRASREYINDSLTAGLNGQVFLTGYSQGGHAAMATHKYIQDNNLYGEFNVIASGPASGAYDMSETTANYIFGNAYSNPGYIVYLIEAYQLAYGNLYTSRDMYYKSPYDSLIIPYLSGDSTMASLNAVLPPFIDSLLQDSVIQNYRADSINFTHPLRRALRDNDVYDWKPEVRVEMSYCESDEQVPFQNSTKTLATMSANGASDVTAVSRGAFFNHGQCVVPSLTATQSLFSGLWDICNQASGMNDIAGESDVLVFPNPARNSFTIEFSQPNTGNFKAQLVSSEGRVVQEFNLESGVKANLSDQVDRGVYYLRIYTPSSNLVKRLVIL